MGDPGLLRRTGRFPVVGLHPFSGPWTTVLDRFLIMQELGRAEAGRKDDNSLNLGLTVE
jgi:hypothetical protein